MIAFILYIIKSTLCLTFFYIIFKALLSRDTFFRINRIVLLGGTVACLILPLIKYPATYLMPVQRPLLELEEALSSPQQKEIFTLEKITTTPTLNKQNTPSLPTSVLLKNIFFSLYLAGISITFLLHFLSMLSMIKIIRSTTRIKKDNYIICLNKGAITAFSWGKYIILSEEDYLHYPEEILTHEKMHIQKKHTFDLIFMECVLLLHWFNPTAWLLYQELKEIHEYQADDGVLKNGIDATKYQLLLVKKAVGGRYTIANSFNHSKIKNRITMMLKEKSNRWAHLKLLLLVPAALIGLSVFAQPEINQTPEMAKSMDSFSGDKVTEKKQTDPKDTPHINITVHESLPSEVLTLFINSQNRIKVFWEKEESEITTGQLEATLQKYFARTPSAGNKNIIINVALQADNQVSMATVNEVKKILRKSIETHRKFIIDGISEELRTYSSNEITACYPVIVKTVSAGKTKDIKCSNSQDIENANFEKAESAIICASGNCQMGFIFHLRTLIKNKNPKLTIEYELLKN